jgi:hypothetical protein
MGRWRSPGRYNNRVTVAGPQRQPERRSLEGHPGSRIYTLEATGLLIMAALILIITLARYWHHLVWSAR